MHQALQKVLSVAAMHFCRCKDAGVPVELIRQQEQRACLRCGSTAHTALNCPTRVYLDAPAEVDAQGSAQEPPAGATLDWLLPSSVEVTCTGHCRGENGCHAGKKRQKGKAAAGGPPPAWAAGLAPDQAALLRALRRVAGAALARPDMKLFQPLVGALTPDALLALGECTCT